VNELGNKDADLKILFAILIGDSYQYLSELERKINEADGEMVEGSCNSGKVYRRWLDYNLTIKITGRKAILFGCEFMENKIQDGYGTVLEQECLPADVRSLIKEQKESLKMCHNKIKELRNMQSWIQHPVELRTSA
jgi:uncharacterized protein (TIGR02284 family)